MNYMILSIARRKRRQYETGSAQRPERSGTRGICDNKGHGHEKGVRQHFRQNYVSIGFWRKQKYPLRKVAVGIFALYHQKPEEGPSRTSIHLYTYIYHNEI